MINKIMTLFLFILNKIKKIKIQFWISARTGRNLSPQITKNTYLYANDSEKIHPTTFTIHTNHCSENCFSLSWIYWKVLQLRIVSNDLKNFQNSIWIYFYFHWRYNLRHRFVFGFPLVLEGAKNMENCLERPFVENYKFCLRILFSVSFFVGNELSSHSDVRKIKNLARIFHTRTRSFYPKFD